LTSERQKAANRANALRSTGPKTLRGKAAIRFNAFRHGLLTQDAVLPGEDVDKFEDLRNQVWAELSPVGPIEEFLVVDIISDMWRLQRLVRAETALFHSRMQGLKADRLANEVRSYEKDISELLYRPPHITDEAAHAEALEALRHARYERDRARSSSDARSMPTLKKGTLSVSSLGTKGVWNGRSFGTSTSFAKCRTSVETVGHPRFPMPLSWTQTIPNERLPASGGVSLARAKAHPMVSVRLAPSQLHCWVKFFFCETNPIGRDHL
jgi:hypothetical protein